MQKKTKGFLGFFFFFKGQLSVSVDGKNYGNVERPIDGFASLAEELELQGTDLWKQGGPYAPFDQEVKITRFAGQT